MAFQPIPDFCGRREVKYTLALTKHQKELKLNISNEIIDILILKCFTNYCKLKTRGTFIMKIQNNNLNSHLNNQFAFSFFFR